MLDAARLILGFIFDRRVLAVLAAAGLLWLGYSWAHGRGQAAQLAIDTPKIEQLERQLRDTQAQVKERDSIITAHRQTIENQHQAYLQAEERLKSDYRVVIADLTRSLDNRDRQITILKKELKDASQKFVPAAADGACVVNRGFVQYHDLAADPRTTAESLGVSASGLTDAAAASGVALSAVGEVVADNYVTCNGIRETLKAWQDWYPKAKAAYDSAVQRAQSFERMLSLPSEK